jgi:hypothetical protein
VRGCWTRLGHLSRTQQHQRPSSAALPAPHSRTIIGMRPSTAALIFTFLHATATLASESVAGDCSEAMATTRLKCAGEIGCTPSRLSDWTSWSPGRPVAPSVGKVVYTRACLQPEACAAYVVACPGAVDVSIPGQPASENIARQVRYHGIFQRTAAWSLISLL